MAQKVKTGDRVEVHYTGRFEDGKVFDSSADQKPLEVKVGKAEVIKGFEDALVGMTVGEKKTVDVSPEEGYGQYDPNLLLELPLNALPDDITPKKGMQLRLMNKQGQSIPVSVSDVKEESVQLDANHPLAGKILTFDIELINIL